MARKKKEETTNGDPKKPARELKIENFTREMRVVLKPDEIAERADRAAQLLAERDEKESELKAAQKHAKSIVETMEAELRRLSNEVRTKATYKETQCERRYDYAAGIISETRCDTGEVVFERAMTEHEKQREFDFPGKPDSPDIDDDFDDSGAAAE